MSVLLPPEVVERTLENRLAELAVDACDKVIQPLAARFIRHAHPRSGHVHLQSESACHPGDCDSGNRHDTIAV